MTREERTRLINHLKYNRSIGADYLITDEDAVEIIKALKQQNILDKIRAEIKDIAFDWQEIDGEHESFMVVDLNDALNIIDKYKAESEG